MPVVRHKTGPMAGKEQTIDATAERIVFGRDPSVCDVVYPPDLTLVARRHFALVRRPSGEWTFDDFGKPYVGVNGTPAEVAQAIDSGDVIELGQPGGPSFEFISGGKNLGSDLPPTVANYVPESPYKTAGKARRIALAATLAALVIGVGLGGYAYWSRLSEQNLRAELTRLTVEQRKIADESIGPAVRDRLLQSAHLVMVVLDNGKFLGGGTGFPVGPDLIATNAHVAELFNRPGTKMYVRAPGPGGKQYEVIDAKMHPGYAAYTRYVQEDPIFLTAKRDCAACGANVLDFNLHNYDVGLLRVAKDANLGPVIEIASQAELEAMKPGMAVGIAGFPTEGIIGSDVQAVAAVPNLRTGMISAMTDMFFLPGDDAHRRLVTHNIGITGGNSGSAMLGANGKLLAVVSAGNMFRPGAGGRQPSGAVINYAQRADQLRELVDGKADENLKAEQAYWNQQTANFARGSEYIIPHQVEQIKKATGVSPELAAEFKGQLTKADLFTIKDDDGKDKVQRQKVHSISAKANTGSLIMAYARNLKSIELYVVVDGKIVAQQKDGSVHPGILISKIGQDTKADVYVVGKDEDVDYQLVHYTWVPKQS